jgi:hypothetical protein
MFDDNQNIFNIYLEIVNNITSDQQKKIADFFVELIVKIEKGDKEAAKLLNLSQDEIIKYIDSRQTDIQQEAFENIRSRISGAFKGTGPATQRYQLFLTSIQKKLWELGQDIQSTKDQNNISEYQNLIQQIQQIEPNMVPTPGQLQKIGYNIGKGVSTVGKIAGTMAGAGLLASGLSTIGLPAMAIGGIVGGGISALKNLSNTNMTPAQKLKKALISAGLGSAVAYAIGELKDAMGGVETATTGNTTSVDIDSVMNDKEYLKELITNYAAEQNTQSGAYIDPNVRITDQYIIFDTPNGESYVDIFRLKDNMKDSIRFGQTPNGLAKYIIDTTRELK